MEYRNNFLACSANVPYTDGLIEKEAAKKKEVCMSDSNTVLPSLQDFDTSAYLSQLDGYDMGDAQKLELLGALASIMSMFVEMGFSPPDSEQLLDALASGREQSPKGRGRSE